jgi:hypothetical protein
LQLFRGHSGIHGFPAGAVQDDAGLLVCRDRGELIQKVHFEHTGLPGSRQMDGLEMIIGEGVDQEKGFFGFKPLKHRVRGYFFDGVRFGIFHN